MYLHPVLYYLFLVLVTLLIFGLISLFIVKLFKFRAKRARSRTYPITLGLTILLSGFIVKNGIGNVLITYLINLFADSTPQKEISSNSIVGDIAFYASVVIISTVYSFFAFKKQKNYYEEKIREIPEKIKKKFPKNNYTWDPIFYRRVKKLFELKYRREKLELDYDDRLNILFGTYKQGLHHHTKIIYCHDTPETLKILSESISEVFDRIKKSIIKFELIPSDSILELHYAIERGVLVNEITGNDIIFSTEDQLLQNLIDFSDYLHKLKANFSSERLPFSNSASNYKTTLSKTYIKPKFFIDTDEEDIQKSLDSYLDNWIKEESHKHLAILGDYGMGKSSFLRYYAYYLAKKILSNQNFERFPVIIPLTNTSPIHGGMKSSVSLFIAENLGVAYEVFEELINRGKVLFLLDGFDEMGFVGSHEQRLKQLNAIYQLATKKNKIIISGRPSYFPTYEDLEYALNVKKYKEEIEKEEPYFERINLVPFNLEEIEDSISKSNFSTDDKDKFFDFIKSNNSLLELCRRPSMMHIVRETLPSLYNQEKAEELNAGYLINYFIDHWLERQKIKKIESSLEDERLKTKKVKEFFKDLAAEYYELGIEKMPAEQIQGKLLDLVSELGLEQKDDIEGFEAEILTAGFVEIEKDEYRFVHKSFKELFIAEKIVDFLSSKNIQHNLIKRTFWSPEVIDFIYDSPRINKSKFIVGVPLLLSLVSKTDSHAKRSAKFFKFKSLWFYVNYTVNNRYSRILNKTFQPIFEILFKNALKLKEKNSEVKKSNDTQDLIKIEEKLGTSLSITFTSELVELFFGNHQSESIGIVPKAFYVSLLKGELSIQEEKLIVFILIFRYGLKLPIEKETVLKWMKNKEL